ncbi:hypothetical protein STEG23_012246 [Scotinomys teguina]
MQVFVALKHGPEQRGPEQRGPEDVVQSSVVQKTWFGNSVTKEKWRSPDTCSSSSTFLSHTSFRCKVDCFCCGGGGIDK